MIHDLEHNFLNTIHLLIRGTSAELEVRLPDVISSTLLILSSFIYDIMKFVFQSQSLRILSLFLHSQ